jgi:hypothetical protein
VLIAVAFFPQLDFNLETLAGRLVHVVSCVEGEDSKRMLHRTVQTVQSELVLVDDVEALVLLSSEEDADPMSKFTSVLRVQPLPPWEIT